MSYELSVVSGEEMIKYLARYGFIPKWQTSSPVVMQKEWRVFSVPLHRELKKGILIGILKQVGIDEEEFRRTFK